MEKTNRCTVVKHYYCTEKYNPIKDCKHRIPCNPDNSMCTYLDTSNIADYCLCIEAHKEADTKVIELEKTNSPKQDSPVGPFLLRGLLRRDSINE